MKPLSDMQHTEKKQLQLHHLRSHCSDEFDKFFFFLLLPFKGAMRKFKALFWRCILHLYADIWMLFWT